MVVRIVVGTGSREEPFFGVLRIDGPYTQEPYLQ